MPVALILSSFVAASRIGGGAQQYVLAAHRIDPVLAPTGAPLNGPCRGAGIPAWRDPRADATG